MKSDATKVHIYVHQALRHRMWAHSEVNWSAVARGAFEETLAKLRRDKIHDGSIPVTRLGKPWLKERKA